MNFIFNSFVCLGSNYYVLHSVLSGGIYALFFLFLVLVDISVQNWKHFCDNSPFGQLHGRPEQRPNVFCLLVICFRVAVELWLEHHE